MSRVLPPSIVENPALDRWVRFLPGRRVRVATGKVELGQGIVTAIGQIAAEELDLPPSAVEVLSGSTADGPDELYTTSSLSIEVSGASVRLACAEARARVLRWVAGRLNCAREELTVAEGRVLREGRATDFDYWGVAPEIDLAGPVTGAAEPKDRSTYRVVGRSVPRTDLPAKVTGPAFIHDLVRPDLLHARTLRQPSPGARLADLDEAAVRAAAGGDLRIVRVGDFVAFVSPAEPVAARAAAVAPGLAVWEGARQIERGQDEAAWLEGQPADIRVLGDPVVPEAPRRLHQASFSRPYTAHAAMAPSCALAEFRGGHLTLWSHGQGMHPLRRTVAAALGMEPENVTAHHVQGAGCYGHNGADDAALDAAIVAREIPDRCIRLQWRREEEFGFEPVGPAMLVTLRVVCDDRGRPVDWTTELWSGVHVQRPGLGGGNLLAAEALPEPPSTPVLRDPPEERGGGATRNAVPLYDVPAHRIEHHLVRAAPVRTSALRGLGAPANVFAIESMIDDLADAAGEDPVAYRLALLSDPRARRVVARAAELSGWATRPARGSGHGIGIGFARYKNRSGYAAVAVEAEVAETVALRTMWCVADAGLVINPDGVVNQLEGGMVQAASWALKERVRLEGSGIASLDWEGYPILRFTEVPEIHTELVEASEHPALGVGECTVGPTVAAIGNAVAHALGHRIRDLPLTRERVMAALLE